MAESTADEVSKTLPLRRCTVYIDGFNWYYSIFQKRPAWKWLNIQSLFEEIRSAEEIVQIRLFTALVTGDKSTRNRQALYLEALRTLPKLRIVHGSFRERERICKGSCREAYRAVEEKKTDVNIAIAMLQDAVDDATDSIVLVSGDSDQEPAILWIKNRHPRIKLTVYIPSLPEDEEKRQNRVYGQQGVTCRFLPLDYMKKHQFPNSVVNQKGLAFYKPPAWA